MKEIDWNDCSPLAAPELEEFVFCPTCDKACEVIPSSNSIPVPIKCESCGRFI